MPQNAALRLPGIEPGSSAWEAPMITITLQAPFLYSRRGSNPRPPAHKTGALPLSYWSVKFRQVCAGRITRSSRNKKISNEATSSGSRTHNLTLRRGAPYPLGHGGVRGSRAALQRGAGPRTEQKGGEKSVPEVGFEPTRTYAQQILSLPP